MEIAPGEEQIEISMSEHINAWEKGRETKRRVASQLGKENHQAGAHVRVRRGYTARIETRSARGNGKPGSFYHRRKGKKGKGFACKIWALGPRTSHQETDYIRSLAIKQEEGGRGCWHTKGDICHLHPLKRELAVPREGEERIACPQPCKGR